MSQKTISSTCFLFFAACGAGATSDGIDAPSGAKSDAWSSKKEKTLTTQVAPPADVHIGRSIAAALSAETATYGVSVDHEVRDDKSQFVRIDGRHYADFDGDDRIDYYYEEYQSGSPKRVEWDDDRDGRINELGIAVRELPDFKIVGYPEGWVPPEYPGMRILTDSDGDGKFDIEAVTGGRSPSGGWSDWYRPE